MNGSIRHWVVFGIVLFAGTCAAAANDAQIDKIIEQSRRTVPACKKYADQVATLVEGEKRDPSKELWNIPKDKETAEKLIELADTYPGADPSLADLNNIVESGGVSADKLKAVYGCNIMAFFDNMKAVADGMSAYKYSAAQRKKAAQIFLKKGIPELSRIPTLIPSILLNSVALQLVASGVLQVSDPVYLALVELDSRLDALHQKIRDLHGDMKEQVSLEWREAPLIARQLKRVLMRVRVQ